jgi:hypothetical protein
MYIIYVYKYKFQLQSGYLSLIMLIFEFILKIISIPFWNKYPRFESELRQVLTKADIFFLI